MAETTRKIQQVSRVVQELRLPGSKSITHRALLLAALAEGESVIRNALVAEDTLLTSKALESLGVRITRDGETVRLVPPAARWAQPAGPILLGNSGTSMRLLLALAAVGSGRFLFDGSARLRERPIGPVVEALQNLGVLCRWTGHEGFPPVEISSSGLAGGEVWVDARQSSQFLSALLIASPCAKADVLVSWPEPVASFPYVAITLAMLSRAGIEYDWDQPNRIRVPAPQVYPRLNTIVEGDCSSASYFWGAAALTGGDVFTHPVSKESLQGDCRFLEVLSEMGCEVRWEEDGVRVQGPGALRSLNRDMNAMPDMVPTLAVLAAFAEGESRIRNVAHLRVKESDRLSVVASELRKFSVPVEELPDGLVIQGGRVMPPTRPIEAHDDHRIAMAFAMAGLRTSGVEIWGAEAVSKSFPSFWELFETLYSQQEAS